MHEFRNDRHSLFDRGLKTLNPRRLPPVVSDLLVCRRGHGIATLLWPRRTMPAATASMTAVHEHVQKWACEENEQRQPGKCMDAMLGEEKEQRDSRNRKEYEPQTQPCSAPILYCTLLHCLLLIPSRSATSATHAGGCISMPRHKIRDSTDCGQETRSAPFPQSRRLLLPTLVPSRPIAKLAAEFPAPSARPRSTALQ